MKLCSFVFHVKSTLGILKETLIIEKRFQIFFSICYFKYQRDTVKIDDLFVSICIYQQLYFFILYTLVPTLNYTYINQIFNLIQRKIKNITYIHGTITIYISTYYVMPLRIYDYKYNTIIFNSLYVLVVAISRLPE